MINKIFFVNLGCARNQVDSETMLGQLVNAGWEIAFEPEEAHAIVVNTCSFIRDAAEESISEILKMAEYKSNRGNCRKLIVTGCLPERYGEDIGESLPEVDIFLGTGAFDQILPALEGRIGEDCCLLPDPNLTSISVPYPDRVYTSDHAAYLKIAEGCDRHCTYCIIPKLRGKQRIRPPEDIFAEAKALVLTGTSELTLIAQDTTAYPGLSRLLESLASLSDDLWIRLLYGHPESIRDDVIKTIASHPNICSYYDLPIQHVSESVLKRMGRQYRKDDLLRLFERIRIFDPAACLRTTTMVGFPGETTADFDELMAFVEEVRFDHLGAFIYSDSEDLRSHHFPDHVSKRVAASRHHRLMTLQSELAEETNRNHIGKILPIIIEERVEDGLFTGRTQFQAAEVDGVTDVYGDNLRIGAIVPVTITDATEYDLIGDAL